MQIKFWRIFNLKILKNLDPYFQLQIRKMQLLWGNVIPTLHTPNLQSFVDNISIASTYKYTQLTFEKFDVTG